MTPRSLLLGLSLCAVQAWAQGTSHPEAPPWGVAVLVGHETGDAMHSYGRAAGVEGTWQFLLEHWVQGRLRGSLISVGAGDGAPDGSGYTPKEAKFLALSCDWIFRFAKGHGPYVLLGAGLNYHQADRHWFNLTDRNSGVHLTLAWGAGWLLQNQVEVEVRQDALMVDLAPIFGSDRDVLTTSVVLRKRF